MKRNGCPCMRVEEYDIGLRLTHHDLLQQGYVTSDDELIESFSEVAHQGPWSRKASEQQQWLTELF